MGQFVSRVHNRQDDKLYNILPMGDMPTVVFGRVIREHSVPGMQYYFSDSVVKFKKEGPNTMSKSGGWDGVGPIFRVVDGGCVPCIFTVPEDLDFNQMNNIEYVKQFCKTAMFLNANTMSPYFVIKNGNIICRREIDKNFHKFNNISSYNRFNISYYDSEMTTKIKTICPRFIFRFLRKRSRSASRRRNIYHYVNTTRIKHVMNNTMLIFPCVKRNRHKIYRSTYCYKLNRFKSNVGGNKYKGRWRFAN